MSFSIKRQRLAVLLIRGKAGIDQGFRKMNAFYGSVGARQMGVSNPYVMPAQMMG